MFLSLHPRQSLPFLALYFVYFKCVNIPYESVLIFRVATMSLRFSCLFSNPGVELVGVETMFWWEELGRKFVIEFLSEAKRETFWQTQKWDHQQLQSLHFWKSTNLLHWVKSLMDLFILDFLFQ